MVVWEGQWLHCLEFHSGTVSDRHSFAGMGSALPAVMGCHGVDLLVYGTTRTCWGRWRVVSGSCSGWTAGHGVRGECLRTHDLGLGCAEQLSATAQRTACTPNAAGIPASLFLWFADLVLAEAVHRVDVGMAGVADGLEQHDPLALAVCGLAGSATQVCYIKY